VNKEECGVPEGVASIPRRSSCPLTGTCEMSSFSHNCCDMAFLVNRMYGVSVELLNVNACLHFRIAVIQEANWVLQTFVNSVYNK
jgi:hypothetical protein